MSQRYSFELVRQRDGHDAAVAFARQCKQQYRRAVLAPTKYGMYKRAYAGRYLEWRRILAEESN